MADVKMDGRVVVSLDDESRRLLNEFVGRVKVATPTRTDMVREMFVEVLSNQERNDKPTVPSDAAIRLQTRIDAEEFVEKLEALYDDPAAIAQLKYMLRWFENRSSIRKDLHERLAAFADALADNAVTNEGFAVLFGIDLEPVFREVHTSNMAKKGGPIVEGKRLKPAGWTAPDVAGVLHAQGWQPSQPVGHCDPIVLTDVWTAPSTELRRHAIPIDHTLWEKETEINLARTLVRFGDLPAVECRVRFSGNRKTRVFVMQCPHAPEQFESYEFCKQNMTIASLSIVGTSVGLVRIVSAKNDGVDMQVECARLLYMDGPIPIDVSIWDRNDKVEIPSALVVVGDTSIVCRVLCFDGGKNRRLMIEFGADDGRFGYWERLRQDKKPCDVSVDGVVLGKTEIASVERGRMRSDGSYVLQIEFAKAAPST